MTENYATVLDRIKSTLIDTMVIIAGMIIFSDVFSSFNNIPDWLKATAFILLFLYEPLCTTHGATLGNYLMDIRVRKNSDTSQQINIFQALLRYFFKLALGWLSFLSIFFSKKSRTIHDIVSGSVMISVKQ